MTSRTFADLKKTADDATRPLPKDWYNVIVAKADAAVASTGSHMLKVQLRVVDGQFANRVLFTNFVLSEDSPFALSIFFRNMAALGFDDAFFNSLTDDHALAMETLAQLMLGRQARAEVGIRVWNGQERNEILSMAQPQNGTAYNNSSVGIAPVGSFGTSAMTSTAPVPPTPSVPMTPPVAAPATPPTPTGINPSSLPPAPAF